MLVALLFCRCEAVACGVLHADILFSVAARRGRFHVFGIRFCETVLFAVFVLQLFRQQLSGFFHFFVLVYVSLKGKHLKRLP